MQKKELLAYLSENINDCSSVRLSSPKVAEIKRTFIIPLVNGRFVQTKTYKVKLESKTPLPEEVFEVNQDTFDQNAFALATDLDVRLTDLRDQYGFRIQVLYEPDSVSVEQLFGLYKPSNFIYPCMLRGKHSYEVFDTELLDALENERSKHDDFINECIWNKVASSLFGLDELMSELNNSLAPAVFTYVISRDSRRIEIMCDAKFIYEATLDETTEFGSAISLLAEISSRLATNTGIVNELSKYQQVLQKIGHFDLDYYQWLDTYRVIVTCPLIKTRGETPISEFVIAKDTLFDLPKLLDEAKRNLIEQAPKYGTIIERIENGESK